MQVVVLQSVLVRRVLADTADTPAADTVGNLVADMDRPLVDEVAAGMALAVVGHILPRQQALQAEERLQPGFDATYCHNSNSERIYPSDPGDRERRCIALRSLGRK